MERQKKTKELKIVGVVYKYTSPSGKVYIGQTTNEAHRRRTWFCTKRRYAGEAINRARAKYGPENFIYEVLFKKEFTSWDEAMDELDKMEIYYIGLYDSFHNGYNNTVGGLFPEVGIQTQLNGRQVVRKRNELTERQLRRFSPKHTKEEIQQLRKETNRKNGRWQKVYQFTTDGKFINEYTSASEAEECGFGSSCNIRRACKTLGNYKGYAWRFARDGKVMKVKEAKLRPLSFYDYVRRPVIQMNKNGEYINEYGSLKDAAKSIGIGHTSCISACLAGKCPTAYGYMWKYKKEA